MIVTDALLLGPLMQESSDSDVEFVAGMTASPHAHQPLFTHSPSAPALTPRANFVLHSNPAALGGQGSDGQTEEFMQASDMSFCFIMSENSKLSPPCCCCALPFRLNGVMGTGGQ